MVETLQRQIGDFFGPFFKIKFYAAPEVISTKPDTSGIVSNNPVNSITNAGRQLQVAQQQGELNSFNLQNYVSNLVVESKLGSTLEFTLTMTPPLDVGLIILDRGLLKFGTPVDVQWGYGGNNGLQVSKNYKFTIIQPQYNFSNEVTITLKGYDITSFGLRSSVTKRIQRGQEGKSDLEIMKELVKDYGYKIELDESINPLNTIFIEKSTPIPNEGSNWQTFCELARSNYVTFSVDEENIISLYTMDTVVSLGHVYTLKFYQKLSDQYDIPLIGFNTNPDMRAFFRPEGRSLFHVSTNPDDMVTQAKKIIAGELPNMGLKGDKTDRNAAGELPKRIAGNTTQNGAKVVNGPDYGLDMHGAHMSSPYGAGNRDSKAEQHVREAAYFVNTNAVARFPGVPDLMPPMSVRVEGVGASLSGGYLVTTVKHEIGTNGYETTAELLRLTSSENVSVGVKHSGPVYPEKPGNSQEIPQGPDSTARSQRVS